VDRAVLGVEQQGADEGQPVEEPVGGDGSEAAGGGRVLADVPGAREEAA